MNEKRSRIHAILPREGDKAVVFYRASGSSAAVVGWDLAADTFTVGPWLRGRLYPYRSDLSPGGEYLLYFAAKFGNVNTVEKFVAEKVVERVGKPNHSGTWDDIENYDRRREKEETAVRQEFAEEIQEIRSSRDYTDRTWTAISRAPFLKALDLWFNGSDWNGGGKFIDETTVWINKPHPGRGDHLHHIRSGRFTELIQPPVPEWETENGGEDPGIYLFRLERDHWQDKGFENGVSFYEKSGGGGLILLKEFGYSKIESIYREINFVRDASGKCLLGGKSWEWADLDARRDRIVYAEKGAIFALDPRGGKLEPRLLHDFGDMQFEALKAPY